MGSDERGLGIYVANRTALVAYATPMLGSREAAEDIVQDAYLRFAPAAARTGTPEQSIAYLYRVVRNLAFDTLKRRKIEAREAKGAPYWAVPPEVRTPEQGALFCDDVRRVAAVLQDLPDEARIAMEMVRFGGHTLEEVARHLGISVATAHRHVRAAMLRVAADLDRDRA